MRSPLRLQSSYRSNSPSVLPHRLATPARALAFWVAVTLPVGYLPLLAIDRIDLPMTVFLALLALNILALILGHDYGR
ncbi:hypothetical protein ACNS7O_02650 [Haloferacaceae archaeon DSL9]